MFAQSFTRKAGILEGPLIPFDFNFFIASYTSLSVTVLKMTLETHHSKQY
jgi:hypothetical protein